MVKTRGNIEENNKTLAGLTHMRDETLNERDTNSEQEGRNLSKIPKNCWFYYWNPLGFNI